MTSQPPDRPPATLTGRSPLERIGRYELLAELGRGSMGRVFLARDPHLDREVAVKVLLPAFSISETPTGWDGEETGRRFLLEARAAGRLAHPGIVLVHDAGEDPETGLLFLVMERVRGPSLEALLRHSGHLEPSAAVEVTRQAARALEAAHRQEVVHRDVKPSNVLLTPEGVVKLTDFGIAKIGGEAMTATGLVLGSPSYMAPEQITGLPVDGRSDVFSLGAVLYRCLGGKLPFPGSSIAEITYKVAHSTPTPLAEIRTDLPSALVACVDKAMARSPEDRFPSPGDFDQALAAVATELGEPELPRCIEPAIPEEPRRLRLPQRSQALGPSTPNPSRPAHSAVLSTGDHSLLDTPGAPADDEGLTGASDDDAPTVLAEPPFSPAEPSAFADPVAAKPIHHRTRLLLVSALAAVALLFSITGYAIRHYREAAKADLGIVAEETMAASRDGDMDTSSSAANDTDTGEAAVAQSEPRATANDQLAATTTSPALQPEEPLPSLLAQLILIHQPKLEQARLTLRLDGDDLWSEEIDGPKSLFGRIGSNEIERRFSIPAGDHQLEAHFEGLSRNLDAKASLQGWLSSGASRTVKITVLPRREALELRWVDDPQALINLPPRPQ